MYLTKEQKVPLVIFMFTSETEHWWRLKKDILLTPTTWDIFMDVFLDNLYPAYVQEKKDEKFLDLY